MNPSDPLAKLEAMQAREASGRDQRKAETRRRWPELAAVMDDLGADAKIICITDHAGNVLAGKMPTPDTFTASAEFLAMATTMGYPRAKR